MLKKLLILLAVYSYVEAKDPVILNCRKTPAFHHSDIPKYFESSNNLLRKTDEFYTAMGQKVLISGRLTDSGCVPISDAKVYIWQTNFEGKYQYKNEDLKTGYDPYFSGSGSVTTDNLGNFSFVTILPGKSDNPYVDFIVKHKDFKTFNTRMFFNPQKDKKLKALVAKKSSESNYEFNICLDQRNVFVSY